MNIRRKIQSFFEERSKFGLFIAATNLLWPFIVRMPQGFASRVIRRKHKAVFNYLCSVCEGENSHQSLQEEAIEKESFADSPIWVCWLQGEETMPILCKKCLESLRKHSGSHPVIVITAANYSNYCYIPEYIVSKYQEGIIRPAHFADIIRTCLLYEKGGLWIDATVFVTRDLPEEIFSRKYFSIKFPSVGYYVTECKWSNYCLSAHPHSAWYAFIRRVFFIYLKKEDLFVDYFLMDYIMKWCYDENDAVRKEVDKIPVNNSNALCLTKVLSEPIDDSVTQMIHGDTYLFKLSWRKTPIDETKGLKTIWSYLKSYSLNFNSRNHDK